MSDHVEIQTGLAIYDRLEPPAQQALNQHLTTCQECAETLASYRAMDRAIHHLVDEQRRYLAAQPLRQPCPSQSIRQPLVFRPAAPRWWTAWLERCLTRRLVALQLTGAGILILLLVVLSLLFAAWQPEQERLIASTPTIERPTATATPQVEGNWAIQVAERHETATPLATAARGGQQIMPQQRGLSPQLLWPGQQTKLAELGVSDKATWVEVDRSKMAVLKPDDNKVEVNFSC